MGACRTDIFQAAAEVFFIGEDGKCGGSGRFVSGRNGICLCVFFYPSFGGRATLELGDDAVGEEARLARILIRGMGSLQLFISISLLMAAFCSSISICLQAMISVNISVIV